MKLHDLQPAPGAHRAKRRVARGTGGKGGKTAGRGTKGQGARDTIPPGFEGGQLPLMQRIPKLQGLHEPVPRRVRPGQPPHPRDLRWRRGHAGDTCRGGACEKGPSSRSWPGRARPAIRVEAHAFSAAAKRRSSRPGARGARPTALRRPPASGKRERAHKPVGLGNRRNRSPAGAAATRRGGAVEPEEHLEGPDLRNKVAFTLLVIAIYELGANIIIPRHRSPSRTTLETQAKQAGILGFLSLFSGNGLLRMAMFGLGIMPYITSSIIIQLLSTVIPKLEEWRDQGALGQKKLTQTTRYLTLGLALLQSASLVYLFHHGALELLGSTAPTIDLIPNFTSGKPPSSSSPSRPAPPSSCGSASSSPSAGSATACPS